MFSYNGDVINSAQFRHNWCLFYLFINLAERKLRWSWSWRDDVTCSINLIWVNSLDVPACQIWWPLWCFMEDGDVNSYINSYTNTSVKVELTISIRHSKRFSKSAILIDNSEVPVKLDLGRKWKAIVKRHSLQANIINRRYCYYIISKVEHITDPLNDFRLVTFITQKRKGEENGVKLTLMYFS